MVQSFVYLYKRKWKSTNNTNTVFEKKFGKWLNENFEVPTVTAAGVSNSAGRPTVDFNIASQKTKKRRVSELTDSYSTNELLFAASEIFKKESNYAAAKKVLNVNQQIESSRYTPDEALAMIIDTGLSKSAYQVIRSGAVEKGCDLYPTYNDIRKAKDNCYPENISVEDYSASIPLKDLMSHTVNRLCEVQKPVIKQILQTSIQQVTRMTLRCKAGFDGATGQSIYKQGLSVDSDDRQLKIEGSLFITCLVPLDLSAFHGHEKITVWRNHKSSSTAYCRPLRFAFKKESRETVLEEDSYLKEQIQEMGVITVNVDNKQLNVTCIIDLTMIDGKYRQYYLVKLSTSAAQSVVFHQKK